IEAWMLNKQTCLLNPNGIDFPRANVYKGSPNYPDTESLQNAINIFYKRNELPGFAELVTNRKEIIQETIQWDDGLNHVRAGNEIIDLIENTKSDIAKENISQKIQRIKQNLQYKLSPILRFFGLTKNIYQRKKRFNKQELSLYQNELLDEQIEFFKKNKLSKSDLRNIRCI
ncbi:MAG: hypothetical protein JW866_09030, partial [Ignavibacteriales bacterium]|nr:hypothetical protein [Ignavibacteriales bacterium]